MAHPFATPRPPSRTASFFASFSDARLLCCGEVLRSHSPLDSTFSPRPPCRSLSRLRGVRAPLAPVRFLKWPPLVARAFAVARLSCFFPVLSPNLSVFALNFVAVKFLEYFTIFLRFKMYSFRSNSTSFFFPAFYRIAPSLCSFFLLLSATFPPIFPDQLLSISGLPLD